MNCSGDFLNLSDRDVWHIVRMYLTKVVVVLCTLLFVQFLHTPVFGGVAAIKVDPILESAESGQEVP